jgi:hypothetical protein
MAEFSMTPFEKAVHAWILKLPGTWTRLDWDKLTQTDDAALDRLVEGGFVQACLPVALHVKGEAGPINTMWMVSGDYRRVLGAQVKSYLVAHGHEGEGTGTISGDYEAVRLTKDGELVKQELEGSAAVDYEVLSRVSGGSDGQSGAKAPGTVYLQPSRPTTPDIGGPEAAAPSTAPVEAKWNMSKREPITNLPVAAEWERLRRDFDRRASEYPPLTLSILMFEPDRVPPYKEKFDQPNHTVMLWQYIGNTRSGEPTQLDKPELTAVAVLEGQDTDLFRRMAYRAGSLLPAAMKIQFAEEIMKNVEKRDRPGKPVFAWNDDPLAVWLNFVLSVAAAFQPERLRRITLPVEPFAISLAAVDLIVSKPKPDAAQPSAKTDTASISAYETTTVQVGAAKGKRKVSKSKSVAKGQATAQAKMKLKEELDKLHEAARDHAYSLQKSGRTPELLPQPSQKDLAQRLEISPPTLSRCLKGDSYLKRRYNDLLKLDVVMGRPTEPSTGTHATCPACHERHDYRCQDEICADRHDNRCEACHREKVHGEISPQS